MNRWLREPLLWFAVAGAGLFAVYARLGGDDLEPVVLSEAGLAVLLSEYEALTGRPADDAARQEIIDNFYTREVLFREGLQRELHRSDRKLRESVVELMQQQVAGEEAADPDGRTLVNFYTDNIERYYREPTISFEQRYFRDAPEEPGRLLEDLRSGLAVEGDPASIGEQFPAYGESMIRGLFGNDALRSLREAEAGRWYGPLESARGWHYFRVSGRSPRQLLPYAAVKSQVLADFQSQARGRALDEYMASQRQRYPLELPP